MADDEGNEQPEEAPPEDAPEEPAEEPAALPEEPEALPEEPEALAEEELPPPLPVESQPPTKDVIREEPEFEEVPKLPEADAPPAEAPETAQAAPPYPDKKEEKIDADLLMPVATPKAKRFSMSKDTPTTTQRKSKMQGSSKARLILGSIVDIKSTVQAEYFGTTKVPRYANSYRLESENPFNHEKVEKILKEVLTETLENLTYDPERCAAQAKNASKNIRQKVKQLEFDRYKIVCMVTIGEKNSQDVFVTCRGLWDIDKDRYSTYAMENTYVYAIAYCFGFYYE